MSSDKPLKDKVAIVTGAAGVLCRSMVEALCKAGCKVVLLDLREPDAIELSKELADKGYPETMSIGCSVLDREDLEKARGLILEKWGSIDLLVNGAGGNSPKGTSQVERLTGSSPEELAQGFFGLDPKAFSQVMDLNFNGTLLPCMVFGEEMTKAGKGVILNISSMSAQLPLTKVGAYSASKAAIDNLTRWLAVHFSKVGVRVNAIAPGFLVSEQNRFLLYKEDGKTLSERGEKIIANTPMEQFGRPEDLHGALVFLCSDASRFVTGIILPIDGGFSSFSGV